MPAIPWVNEAAALSAHLVERNKPRAAAIMAARALALMPNEPALWTNLGAALYGMRNLPLAKAALDHSLSIYPKHPITISDLALVALSGGERELAAELIEQALLLEEDNASLLWNRALMRLSEGDYARGFADYESRIKSNPKSYPMLPLPMWQGEHLFDKVIHVEIEQGTGDAIMFSRFLPWLAKRAKRVTFRSTKIAEPLFSRFGNYVSLLDTRGQDTDAGENLPIEEINADCFCYLASLAYHSRLRSPADVPEDPGCIKAAVLEDGPEIILPEPHSSPAIKVGIAWAGNPLGEQYEEKSVPFDLLMTLAQDPRVWLYSLQADDGRKDVAKYGASNFVYDFGEELLEKGFLATGRAILACDLVISCCTSVAHLSAALGKPTWLMVAYEGFWPWGLEGDKTPWYPSMRLFRQKERSDWKQVINDIQKELYEF